MRILCLSKRWKHHSSSSGYDRLPAAVGAIELRRRLLPLILSKVVQISRKALSLDPPHLIDYRYEDLRAEREVLAMAEKIRPDIVHVLHGDEQLDLLLRTDKRLPCPLVVSFHLPTFRSEVRFNSLDAKALSRIDGVILLASSQLQECRAWFREDQLFYVPHGIDTDRFQPGEPQIPAPGIRLATVGTHMRDWEAIERIIQKFESCGSIRFDVVDFRSHCSFLKKYKNVRLLSSLPESELIKLYQEADALLLPVTSATANNSALESLACGTPVISTAIGGMPDYVDASCGRLFPKGEVDGIVDLIHTAMANRAVFSELRQGARQRAMEFSWNKVAERLQNVYEDVMSKGKSVRSDANVTQIA
jgi:glycosyltransferase involved in cell wall biosynthesis